MWKVSLESSLLKKSRIVGTEKARFAKWRAQVWRELCTSAYVGVIGETPVTEARLCIGERGRESAA